MKQKLLMLTTLVMSTSLMADGLKELPSQEKQPVQEVQTKAQEKGWNVYASLDGVARHNMLNIKFVGDGDDDTKHFTTKFKIHPGLSLGGKVRLFNSQFWAGAEGSVLFGAQRNYHKITRDIVVQNYTLDMKYKNTYGLGITLGYDCGQFIPYARSGVSFTRVSITAEAPALGVGQRVERYVKKNMQGMYIGGGFEYKINSRFSTALEYEHAFYKAIKIENLGGLGPASFKLRPQTSAIKLRFIAKI